MLSATSTPTHVQVAVMRTRDLVIKGKNGTNDVYIIYSLGKEKYQSSLQEKVSSSVLEWNEGCDISIPSSNGNKAEIVIKVMHKASLGDKCLGRISLPLSNFDFTAKPKMIWYKLKPKPGNEKDTKNRGEIEVKVSFLIKTPANHTASSNDLAGEDKKRKGSLKSSMGSILSLGKKKKKKEKDGRNGSKDSLGSSDSLRNSNLTSSRLNLNNNLPIINDDPGVISEEEDFFKDNKSAQSGSINSGSYSEKLNGSMPSTPKSSNKISSDFTESSFNKVSVASQDLKNKNNSSNNTTKSQQSPSPKPRVNRLPSVIDEESPFSSYIEPQETEKMGSSVTSLQPSIEARSSPPSSSPKSVPKKSSHFTSASMSNLADPGSKKGSITKSFMKAMFASSKHIDEYPHGEHDGGKASSKSNTLPFNFPKTTKTRGSIRDLGIPKETYKQYQNKSKEELIAIIVSLQGTVDTQKEKVSDMEDYIDKLLLRVLDNMPSLLSRKASSARLGDSATEKSFKV